MLSPLAARGLSKRFGSVWALRDVNIDIQAGAVTALVGPNGAGKSTLLRTWVGFERPTEGEALVLDANPWSNRGEALEHIGYVPQSEALYADFSADEHFAFARRYRARFDTEWGRRRLVELGISSQRAVRGLSGGQRAQVMLTLALATRGEVLLLDEPLASLDPLARRDFLHLVTDVVRDEGRTAVLSSHVIADVEQACDAVVIVREGRIVLHATVDAAIDGHAIVRGATADRDRVGSFREAGGESVTLVARPPGIDPTIESRANLEQVVLGYLASGQSNANTSW